MSISAVITLIMAVFFVIGAFDRLFGNRLGFGREFERGFMLMGVMGLSVLGLMSLAPVIGALIKPVLGPFFSSFGADASLLAGALLSCDIGYPVAAELAESTQIAQFNGLIVGSVMGYVVSFAIPVACGLISKEDYRPFGVGILSAYIFNPLACLIGGLLMGVPFRPLILNLIPVIIIAAVIVCGLLFFPDQALLVFKWFSRIILAAVTVGLVSAAFETMTGIVIIPGLRPMSEGFRTVGIVTLTLAGALSFLFLFKKVLGKPLDALGERMGVDSVCIMTTVMAFSTLIPGYESYGKMNSKSKVIYSAFSASGGCMLGAHLGYTTAINPELVMPMLIAKIIAAVLALAAASFFYVRLIKAPEQGSETENG